VNISDTEEYILGSVPRSGDNCNKQGVPRIY